MKLRDVLAGLPILDGSWSDGEEITGVAYDSRAVEPGVLFAALKGEARDGLDFIHEAKSRGAAAVLSERPSPQASGISWIRVADAREAVALAAANFHGNPAGKMTVVGVTGTKGKTTVTYLLEKIFEAAGAVPGVVGTIEYRYPGRRLRASRTTPEAPDLQAFLAEMLANGVTHCLMEVSSHALELKRVWGVGFDAAVFTNLSGEHLDYHPSMEGYFEAKKKLFRLNHKRKASVANVDDPWGRKLTTELPMRTVTFGLEPEAVVRAVKFSQSESGLEIQVESPGAAFALRSKLVGRHNVANILAATAAALALNVAPQDIQKGVSTLEGVPGRFEKVASGRDFQVYVDYAHTDNALENVLLTARELRPRRLIAVFGAGGDRDKQKRERMGRVAARRADWTVLTSDNPRSEDPLEIIAGIERGFSGEGVTAYEIVPDRREAIAKALAEARKGDIVLVAGKGHEDTQTFKDRTIHFSDHEVIAEILGSGGAS
jgi:UDP-N-acetylmuramoyl-L-alanyl-D-glutamate--2,6-diaminopimelate ligase